MNDRYIDEEDFRALERSRILNKLHDLVGVCGHCGKRKCAGRKSHSVLPETVKTDDVLKAIGGEQA